MYYNKEREKIDMAEWSEMFKNRDYKRIAMTDLPDGKIVSTVWLGLDHSYGKSPPLIFETMVFPSKDDFTDIDGRRYATLDEAEAGHEQFVRAYTIPRDPG